MDDVAEVPDYAYPLFFTSQTQEIFECKGDEQVTEESPYKIILKEKILKDFKDRAAISDFSPAKKIVEVRIYIRSYQPIIYSTQVWARFFFLGLETIYILDACFILIMKFLIHGCVYSLIYIR